MEQKVEISKSEYALDLLARFNHFRKTNKHCDFIIRAGKKEMPVHKSVISASSEYFEAMLSHDTIENQQGLVEIKQVDPECIVKCVDFMYTGEASVSNEKQRDLMHVAHMLRLERLYNGIAVFLEKKLDCSTFFSTNEIANLYDCKQLVKHCNKFAMENFREIARLDDFKNLEVEYVKFLLSSQELEETDAIKCKAVMVWINYDSGRAASLFDLLKQIDFSKVPIRYRRFLLENEPAIGNSNDCLKHLMKSILTSLATDTTTSDMTLEDTPGIIVLDSGSARMKCFDLVEETWSDMKEMHPDTVNKHCSVVALDEYVYIFVYDKTSYRLQYKRRQAEWEQLANRNGHWGSAVVLNGNVYCAEDIAYSNRIERYDVNQDQWSFTPNKSAALLGSAIVVFENSLLLIGGLNEMSINTVERFHPSTSSWSIAPTLQHPRLNASATSLNGVVYLFGGYYNYPERRYQNARNLETFVESVEILHPNSNSWELVNMCGFSRQNFSSHTIDGKIYLVGNRNSSFNTIEEFEPKEKTLKTLGTLTDMTVHYFSSVAVLK